MTFPFIFRSASTDSTNRQLADFLRDGLPDGSVFPEFGAVMADFQTGGRGQGSNRWHSEAGLNLLISTYFRPPIPAARQFVFNEFFALCVRNFVSSFINEEVKIKWPNDIYVNDRKIAGILIEHSVIGDDIRYSIAGLGLNINETDFPSDLPNPISISQLIRKQYDINELAAQLLAVFQSYFMNLKEEKWEKLEQEYFSHLYRMEKFSFYIVENQKVEAKITGVDKFGRLLLVGRGGEKWCCGQREIKYVL